MTKVQRNDIIKVQRKEREVQQMKSRKELCEIRNAYASKFDDERVQPQKLYSCNARIYDEGENVYLYSYNTLVAMYSKTDKIVYRFGRFSNTTYQHMRKFRNWCWENYHPTDKAWDIIEHMEEFENWYR